MRIVAFCQKPGLLQNRSLYVSSVQIRSDQFSSVPKHCSNCSTNLQLTLCSFHADWLQHNSNETNYRRGPLQSVRCEFQIWGLGQCNCHRQAQHCTLYTECVGSCDYMIAVCGSAVLAVLCGACGIAAGRTHVLSSVLRLCIGVLNWS